MLKVVDLLRRDSNIFDSLRMLSAVLVIFSHAYALTGLKEPQIQDVTPGRLAVRVFFILSGLLIAASWSAHPRVAVFLGKRLLRILPALFVVIILTTFVIGPLYSSLDIIAYFTSYDTYLYLNGLTVLQMQFSLPGVFGANPFPNSVNGSLWTLPYELTTYILLALGARAGLLKKTYAVLGAFFFCAFMYFVTLHKATGLTLFGLNANSLFYLSGFFLAGVVFYVYRERIALKWQFAAAALLLLTLLTRLGLLQLALLLALPYLVIFAGSLTSTGLQKIGKYGDFSYGLYIYGWLVEQCVVASAHGHIGYKLLFLIAFPITLVISMMSWYLIEKPALGFKGAFNEERYPVAGDAW